MARLWRKRPKPPAGPGDVMADPGLEYLDVLGRIDDAVLLVSAVRIVDWLNPATRRSFEVPDHPVGRPLVEVLRDHRIDALADRVLTTGLDEAIEVVLPVSGRALHIRAAPLASRRGLSLIIRDQTRLRQLETVRQQFVANLSHELRTPLAGLDLAAQTLAGQLPRDGDIRIFMDRILQESGRLAAIVLNLAQLSALDAEQMAVERQAFSVPHLLREVVERFEPRARAAGLALLADAPDQAIMAAGDRAKTDQALQNIVDNALKFTANGEVVLTAGGDAAFVEIAVADSGVGIPPQELPRIFERFYKVDRARGRQVPGTGLGLSIARRLIELQGGRLVAESRPGVGTTFRLFLPRAASPP